MMWLSVPWHQVIKDVFKEIFVELAALLICQPSFITCMSPIANYFNMLGLSIISFALHPFY